VCGSVLQCVAVCCSMLQCVALCCIVLQYVVVCCNVLQCFAVRCSVLQSVAVCCIARQRNGSEGRGKRKTFSKVSSLLYLTMSNHYSADFQYFCVVLRL